MPLGVEGEEAGEDFVAGLVGPAETVGLFLFALLAGGLVFVVFLVVEEEFAGGRDVGPPVGVEHGAVHRGVQAAEFSNVGRPLLGVVDTVVGLRQALVVPDHQGGAEFVVGSAGFFQGGGVFPVGGKGECLEAVGRGVNGSILKR